MTARFDELTDPLFLATASDRSIEELRAARDEATSFESGLSYIRRMIQGRVDIVGAELQRRFTHTPPPDSDELVGALTEILSEGPSPGTPTYRAPLPVMPPDVDEEILDQLEEIIGAGELAELYRLSDEALDTVAARLADLERAVSHYRRRMHEHIDAVQAEIIARYRRGDLDVDSLLRHP